jgi:hypothetical protein
MPPQMQRIRLTVGAPPGTESITYLLNGETLGTVQAEPWALWWTLKLGDFELVAQAAMQDGTRQASVPIPFEVTNYAPPESRTVINP